MMKNSFRYQIQIKYKYNHITDVSVDSLIDHISAFQQQGSAHISIQFLMRSLWSSTMFSQYFWEAHLK